MRNIVSAGLMVALIAFAPPFLPAAAQQSSPAPGPSPSPGPPANPNPNGELQTPDRAGTANLGAAATAPLHDLNITRQGIPPVLLAAITNPYERPNPFDCGEITRQLEELNFVLGSADLGEPGNASGPEPDPEERQGRPGPAPRRCRFLAAAVSPASCAPSRAPSTTISWSSRPSPPAASGGAISRAWGNCCTAPRPRGPCTSSDLRPRRARMVPSRGTLSAEARSCSSCLRG